MGIDGHPTGSGSHWTKGRHMLLQFFLSLFITSVLGLEGEEIIGGKIASIREFPHHVVIRVKDKPICGGGIINQQFIITAAHCVAKASGHCVTGPIQVVGGVDDLNSWSPLKGAWDVTEIYLTQRYFTHFTQDLSGDIAILKLNQVINFAVNPGLGFLRLPSANDDFVGRKAVITGHGYSEIQLFRDLDTGKIIKEGKSDGKLRSLNTIVLSQEKCSAEKKYSISNDRLCTKIRNLDNDDIQGPCKGDSGSSLVVDKNILIGVISVGPENCNENNGPSTYTRVTSYMDFINAVLENRPDPTILRLVLSSTMCDA